MSSARLAVRLPASASDRRRHATDDGAETEHLIINTFTYMKKMKAPPVVFYQVRALMILCAARDSNPEPAD